MQIPSIFFDAGEFSRKWYNYLLHGHIVFVSFCLFYA